MSSRSKRLLLVVALSVSAEANFLARNVTDSGGEAANISTHDVEVVLNASIHDERWQDRKIIIEKHISCTFQALPKNALGRLSPPSVRHIVHNYFAKVHGWRLEGLEPQSARVDTTDLHSVSILQEKAQSLVEAMMESRQSGRGLSVDDIIVVILTLEMLAFDESLSLLRSAYFLHDLSSADNISQEHLLDVLFSYIILFRQGKKADPFDKEAHFERRARLMYHESFRAAQMYEHDIVLNQAFAVRDLRNPFVGRSYSFDAAADVLQELTNGYGKFQDRACNEMKHSLISLGKSDSGRVPLDRFYSSRLDGSGSFFFTESTEYLESIGALDKTNPKLPQVRIANYILGPTNCISHQSYYSVCCLNECEIMMSEIESAVQAPMAAPEHLIRLVTHISSDTVGAPRVLPRDLVTKLHAIAARHSGGVPLHGRLFAQWMHFAYPNECPYPAYVQAESMAPSTWSDGRGRLDDEERIRRYNSSLGTEILPSGSGMAEWTDEEVVLTDEFPRASALSNAFRFMGTLIRFAPIPIVLRFAYSALQTATKGGRATEMKFQSKDSMFDFI